jgi:hypothetical protein
VILGAKALGNRLGHRGYLLRPDERDRDAPRERPRDFLLEDELRLDFLLLLDLRLEPLLEEGTAERLGLQREDAP